MFKSMNRITYFSRKGGIQETMDGSAIGTAVGTTDKTGEIAAIIGKTAGRIVAAMRESGGRIQAEHGLTTTVILRKSIIHAICN